MVIHNLAHSRGVVRRQCLGPLDLSVPKTAAGIEATRQALSDLVREEANISVEMATRLSKAFGSTPETWLGLQMPSDLWQARDRAAESEVQKSHAA